MNAIIKWPGGKSREIDMIQDLIPAQYDRYVEISEFFANKKLQ